jgi:hypothetical protein
VFSAQEQHPCSAHTALFAPPPKDAGRCNNVFYIHTYIHIPVVAPHPGGGALRQGDNLLPESTGLRG